MVHDPGQVQDTYVLQNSGHKTNNYKNPMKENELFRIINRMMDSHEAIGKFQPPKERFFDHFRSRIYV